MTPAVPRGLRLNNPGNIRKSSIAWQGEVAGADSAFESFATPQDGIRALAKILLHYQKPPPLGDGLKTVRQMISRWAPPNENQTDSYVQQVASAMGVLPDDPISLATKPATLTYMVKAIILRENGRQPYAETTLDAGIGAALGRDIATA